jgi:phosphate-selective porin OprO and OprP
MNFIQRQILPVCLLAGLASSAQADVTIDVLGDYEVVFEGLIQADANYFSNDFGSLSGAPLTPAQRISNTFIDDTGLRRAELIFKGKNARNDWSVAYEARANRWLDTFFRHKIGGFSSIRAGQYKQPSSLEELTSTRHNDFVAKSLTTSAFAIARRLGVEYATGGPPWTLTASAFSRELSNNGQKASGFGTRATWAPIMKMSESVAGQADEVFHLGISAVGYDPSKDSVRISVRPEADFANIRLIDTANLTDTEGALQLGLEAAYLNGPLKLNAEFVDARYTRKTHADYSPSSWYVSGVYNLTGEKFGYAQGLYTVPVPDAEKGMWQVAARYSKLNANDGLVLGGEQDNFTVGINWYWRLNFKFMANYNVTRSNNLRTGIDNDPNIVELRAQIML